MGRSISISRLRELLSFVADVITVGGFAIGAIVGMIALLLGLLARLPAWVLFLDVLFAIAVTEWIVIGYRQFLRPRKSAAIPMEGSLVSEPDITGATPFSSVWRNSYASIPAERMQHLRKLSHLIGTLERLTLGEIALLDAIEAANLRSPGPVSRHKCEAILRAAGIEHPSDSIVKLEDRRLIVEPETDKFLLNPETDFGTGTLRGFKTLLTYHPQLVTAYRTVTDGIEKAGLMP